MTEAEWLTCSEPKPLLEFLTGRASDRKLRLFAVDCCRRVKHLLRDGYLKNSRKAIGVVERHIEGAATFEQVRAVLAEVVGDVYESAAMILHAGEAESYAAESAVRAIDCLRDFRVVGTAYYSAYAIAYDALATQGDPVLERIASEHAVRGWRGEAQARADEAEVIRLPGYVRALAGERVGQTARLHDIFGNPFRPIIFSPSWRTSTAIAIAAQMYESRNFGAMPILADALQDAGCDDEDVLSHCREPREHVRGCWVVDLLLGKS